MSNGYDYQGAVSNYFGDVGSKVYNADTSFGSSSSSTKPPDTGGIAGGVISGITNIATILINANRIKNAYKFNASMLELQGRMVRLQANQAIKDIRAKGMSMFSTQRALYAKAGVKMSGSPIEVMADSLKESELDAIFTDINATYNIGTLKTQAEIYRDYGRMEEGRAKISAAKTILNTSYDVYRINKEWGK